MKKRLILILVLLVAAGLAWYLVRLNTEEEKVLKLFGNVDIREVELSFRVPGKLAEVRVDEGDPVTAGEVVAVLDARPYEDALAKALADRDVAAANMAKYRAGYRSEDIAQARAQVARLEAEVKNAVTSTRRKKDLLASQVIAEQDYDDAVAARDALLAQLNSAKEALRLQLAGFRTEDVTGAEASLRAAEAAVASARTNLEDTRLVCPSDGTVLSRVREPGAVAEASATVLVVSLDRPVWVRAYVPEPLFGKTWPGMPVLVHTDSRPGKPYKGTIGFVSPVAEFTPKNVETESQRTDLVYRLRIVVQAPDKGLRQGMPVTVTATPEAEQGTGDLEGAPR